MKFGLALGGGSLRGAVHIGFLDILLQNGIKPDIIAGTSAGAIVAGLYASGVAPSEMQTYILRDKKKLSHVTQRSLSLIPTGLLSGNKLEFIFKKLTREKKFTDLSLPVAIVATNIQNGMPVIFTSPQLAMHSKQKNCIFLTDRPVYEAIRASISLPGIFKPKKVKGMTLVDGGLVSNVPADVLKFMGVKKVLAVNLGFGVMDDKSVDSLPDILLQSVDIMGERVSQNILKNYANFVVQPKTEHVYLWQVYKIPRLIELGREIAQEKLKEIKQFILTD